MTTIAKVINMRRRSEGVDFDCILSQTIIPDHAIPFSTTVKTDYRRRFKTEPKIITHPRYPDREANPPLAESRWKVC